MAKTPSRSDIYPKGLLLIAIGAPMPKTSINSADIKKSWFDVRVPSIAFEVERSIPPPASKQAIPVETYIKIKVPNHSFPSDIALGATTTVAIL
jgi:hypothetical protein